MNNYVVFDIETDNLLPLVTKVHCIALQIITDTDSGHVEMYTGEHIKTAVDIISKADKVIGHNIINYDLPVLYKLYDMSEIPHEKIFDTLLYARLLLPDIGRNIDNLPKVRNVLPSSLFGKYSLEAFGYRLGILKGSYGKQVDAWDELTDEMIEYCKQDVRVTTSLYRKLYHKYGGRDVLSLMHMIETRFSILMQRQMANGIYFDREGAERLVCAIQEQYDSLEKVMAESVGLIPNFRSGHSSKKWTNPKRGKSKGQPYTNIQYERFKPTSPVHLRKLLCYREGWIPNDSQLTDLGLTLLKDLQEAGKELSIADRRHYASFSAESLEQLAGKYNFIDDILLCLNIRKLLSQLLTGKSSWLRCVNSSNYIYGAIANSACATRRCSHFAPNLAQVPSNKSFKGAECRALFTLSPEDIANGFVITGCDASGLELRCLGHYLAPYDGGEYAKVVAEGSKEDGTDVHTFNMHCLGLTDRNLGKRFIYAWLYGGGNPLLGSILGGDELVGLQAKQAFINKVPALQYLKAELENTYKTNNKCIESIDGYKLKVRKKHTLLNTLFQSAGAIIMKLALILFVDMLEEEGLYEGRDFWLLLNIHDEFQVKHHQRYTELIQKLAIESIRKAGVVLKMNIPLDGEAQTGLSWAETH